MNGWRPGSTESCPARRAVPVFDATPAPKEALLALMEHLEEALDEVGYFRTADKRPAMVQNIRAVLQRAGFTLPEITMLRGVVASLQRRHEKTPRE